MEQHSTIQGIPIFPLNVVLFPGMPLPLHIFEERYKTMIARCLEGDRIFGVNLLKEGQEVGGTAVPYAIGTVARIVRHVRTDDGRYNLITRGLFRYQVLASQYDASGYLTAQVEPLEEEEVDPHRLDTACQAVSAEFIAYLSDLAGLTGMKIESVPIPDGATTVSYFVAHYLPVYAWEKQRLLESASTDVRLIEELRLLRRERGMIREFGAAPAIYVVADGQGPRLLQN